MNSILKLSNKDGLGYPDNEKWFEEIESLSYNDTDRSTVLDLLLSTYELKWIDALEDILHSPQAEELCELILSIKERRKGIVNG